MNDLVAEQHALGAFRRAMEEMEALAEEIGGQLHVDHDTLRCAETHVVYVIVVVFMLLLCLHAKHWSFRLVYLSS